ncbi:MAG: ECF transporter S component [Promethearchaeota archaeon]
MKKSNIILIILLGYGFFTLFAPTLVPNSILSPINTESSAVLLNSIIYLSLFIVAMYFRLEESNISTKELTFIVIYSTFTAIARIPFAGIPNFQPCSFLIICAGIVFGPLVGFIIGGNVALISNIFLGHGPWTIYQIFAWGSMGASAGIFSFKYRAQTSISSNSNDLKPSKIELTTKLKNSNEMLSENPQQIVPKNNIIEIKNNKNKKIKNNSNFSYIKKIYLLPSKILLYSFSFVWGFFFGWIMNIWYWIRYIDPHTIESFFLLNLTNIAFDFSHALSNLLFLMFFGNSTLRILQRFKIRFKLIYKK